MTTERQICVGAFIACMISLFASIACGALNMPGAEDACGIIAVAFAILFGATLEVPT
ncbi:MAG: hypothetical protein AAF564_17795 [Bacteroidota bacterium]